MLRLAIALAALLVARPVHGQVRALVVAADAAPSPVAEALRTRWGVPAAQVVTLQGPAATADAVVAAAHRAAGQRADAVVVYVALPTFLQRLPAGHDVGWLLPPGAAAPSNASGTPSGGLLLASLTQALARSAARRVLLVVDAPGAGFVPLAAARADTFEAWAARPGTSPAGAGAFDVAASPEALARHLRAHAATATVRLWPATPPPPAPATATAQLRVEGLSGGATVWVDGAAYASDTPLAAGDHLVAARMGALEAWRGGVVLLPGETRRLALDPTLFTPVRLLRSSRLPRGPVTVNDAALPEADTLLAPGGALRVRVIPRHGAALTGEVVAPRGSTVVLGVGRAFEPGWAGLNAAVPGLGPYRDGQRAKALLTLALVGGGVAVERYAQATYRDRLAAYDQARAVYDAAPSEAARAARASAYEAYADARGTRTLARRLLGGVFALHLGDVVLHHRGRPRLRFTFR